MKAKINEKCIGCGSCIAITDSKIFDYNDEGLAECVKEELTPEDEKLVDESIKYCPTDAIEKY